MNASNGCIILLEKLGGPSKCFFFFLICKVLENWNWKESLLLESNFVMGENL